MEEPSSPGYYFRGSSHTSSPMICWQNEQGEPAANNSKINRLLCWSQNNHTSAILFDSGELWPDDQLRMLRLLVSSLWLGASHSKPQNQWTGVERLSLFPAERQGRWVQIPQVDHPHTCTPTLITPGAMFYKQCQGNYT